MEQSTKVEIIKISKDFASGFKPEINKIAGSGWLIVDPLSAYLNGCGYKNELKELPQTDDRNQILIIIFEDGTPFIPAGSDLNIKDATDWMFI